MLFYIITHYTCLLVPTICLYFIYDVFSIIFFYFFMRRVWHALKIGLSVRTKKYARLSPPMSNCRSKSCLFAFMYLLFTFRFNVRQLVTPLRRRSAYSATYLYLFPTTISLDVMPSSNSFPVRKLNKPIRSFVLRY